MQAQGAAVGAAVKVFLTIGVACLVTGCVQPGYVQPGPIQLQPYPPPVSYQSTPDYRPSYSGPIPLLAPPPVQPLPPATPAPTEPPTDNTGPIPVQDMPPPAPDPATPSTDATPPPAATPPEFVRKTPVSGPGNNVPLEGFRPMKGQTRPTP